MRSRSFQCNLLPIEQLYYNGQLYVHNTTNLTLNFTFHSYSNICDLISPNEYSYHKFLSVQILLRITVLCLCALLILNYTFVQFQKTDLTTDILMWSNYDDTPLAHSCETSYKNDFLGIIELVQFVICQRCVLYCVGVFSFLRKQIYEWCL